MSLPHRKNRTPRDFPMKMALRNIAAYKKRTIVTVLLTSLTTALLVFASAWLDGSHQTMIKNAVEIYPGYLQITGKEFRDQPSYEHLIFDSATIREKLAGIEGIAIFAARFESFVLYSADEKAVGGMLTGIEPEKEAGLSRISASLQEGEYLTAEDTNQVYIGNELAKRLKVGIGDEIAFVGNGVITPLRLITCGSRVFFRPACTNSIPPRPFSIWPILRRSWRPPIMPLILLLCRSVLNRLRPWQHKSARLLARNTRQRAGSRSWPIGQGHANGLGFWLYHLGCFLHCYLFCNYDLHPADGLFPDSGNWGATGYWHHPETDSWDADAGKCSAGCCERGSWRTGRGSCGLLFSPQPYSYVRL